MLYSAWWSWSLGNVGKIDLDEKTRVLLCVVDLEVNVRRGHHRREALVRFDRTARLELVGEGLAAVVGVRSPGGLDDLHESSEKKLNIIWPSQNVSLSISPYQW